MSMAMQKGRSAFLRRRIHAILFATINSVVGVGSFGVIVWRFVQWWHFTELSDFDNGILWGTFAVGAIYTFASFCLLVPGDLNKPGDLIRASTADLLDGAAVWIAILALVASAGVMAVEFIPHRLSAFPNTVLLMDDGRVIPAGSSVEVPRNRITDVQVNLERNDVLRDITVSTPAGAITLRVGFTFYLRQGEILNQLIRGKSDDLGKNTDDRKAAQENFFGQPIEDYLTPYAGQIVAELQSGMTDGSESKLITRLTQIIKMRGGSRPAWLAYLSIRDVQVVQGVPSN